ncbi:unnamed protein product, partial [Allacma fusca]
TFLTQA